MNFANKIFISILTVSLLACFISIGTIYYILKNDMQLEYSTRYQANSETIISTFHYLEQASDLANKNAVLLLSEICLRKGIPTDKELNILAKKFGVNGFYIINKYGKFIRSSDLPIEKQVNSLFSYNKNYRLLITGNSNIATTPIIPSYPYDVPAKLTMIPNHNRTLILESSTHLEYIGKILQQILSADKNIKTIGLYTPTGYELGSISASGKFHQGQRNAINDLSLTNKIVGDTYIFSKKIPTIVDNCPECIQKGVSLDGQYFYLLRMEISLLPLHERLGILKMEILFLFVIMLFSAIIISRFISNKLVGRLENISLTANTIIKNKNLNLQVKVDGKDEISNLSATFNTMITELKTSQDNLLEAERIKSTAKISAQLAHDIRSPLAVMEMILALDKKNIHSCINILTDAIQSVRDIANNLLLTNHDHLNEKANATIDNMLSDSIKNENLSRPVLLASLVESIVSQKRQEWKNKPCDLQFVTSYDNKLSWISVAPNETKRMLSNLLNNSYESLNSNKIIEINLLALESCLQLNIIDQGCGIPSDKINDVLTGISLKQSGKGLGLSSAKQYMEKIGGQLLLDSTWGKGTKITLLFPTASKPNWFPDEIKLYENSHVVVLDDDINIHNIWRHRLQPIGVHTRHFYSSTEIIKWHNENMDICDHAIYLVDYELYDNQYDGIKLLQKFSPKKRGYLITSHAEEIVIQKNCQELDIWLLPKKLASEISIVYSN